MTEKLITEWHERSQQRFRDMCHARFSEAYKTLEAAKQLTDAGVMDPVVYADLRTTATDCLRAERIADREDTAPPWEYTPPEPGVTVHQLAQSIGEGFHTALRKATRGEFVPQAIHELIYEMDADDWHNALMFVAEPMYRRIQEEGLR